MKKINLFVIIFLLLLVIAGLVVANFFLYQIYFTKNNLMPEQNTNLVSSPVQAAVYKEYALEDTFPIIEKNYPDWIARWKKVNPDFSLQWQRRNENTGEQEFSQKGDGEIGLKSSDDFIGDLADLNKDLLALSPDKKMAVNIYSGGDPDTDVKLIDLGKKKSKTILSCGPDCGFNHAFWLDNNTFFVLAQGLGMHEMIGKGTYYTVMPLIELYNLEKNSHKTFAGFEVEEEYFYKQLGL